VARLPEGNDGMMHFDEMTGLLYLEGQLDASHAKHVEEHAKTCGECRGLLRALDNESVWLREALAQDEESIPARVMEEPSGGRLPWGWLATLGIGAAGTYTIWSAMIEPWRAQAAEAGFTQGNLLTMLFFSSAFWKGWDAMRSLMESSAVAILAIVLMWLLRKRMRRATIGVVVASVILGALTLPAPAMAAQREHGDPNYTLPAGKEIKTDLIVAADSTQIDGDVDGDVIVFSQYITVNGHVKGDVLGFGQDLRINGTVDGNVRGWCQFLVLTGKVAKNLMVWSERTEVAQKASVGGTMTVGAEDIEVNGRIDGDVLAYSKDLKVDGLIGGDVDYTGARMNVGSTGEIQGKTHFSGREEPKVTQGAKLGSQIEFAPRKHGPNYTQARYYWHRVLLWGASVIFGILFLLLAPGFFLDATNAVNRFGLATGFGILFLIATPIVAVLACCTIVGIGAGVSTMLLYVVAVYGSQTLVGCWLGEKLLGPSHGVASAMGRMALGLGILRVAGMLPYWIGAMVSSVVVVCGLGAIVLAAYRKMKAGTPVVATA
jgi:cytoskeletal protein CcmA (bactofilin family)